MRTAILDGTLPSGTKLVESELADRFGTSRGPVREAIRELAREGLVAELPRRGTVVSTLTARDLAEVYAVREGLELTASKAVIDRVQRRAAREPRRGRAGDGGGSSREGRLRGRRGARFFVSPPARGAGREPSDGGNQRHDARADRPPPADRGEGEPDATERPGSTGPRRDPRRRCGLAISVGRRRRCRSTTAMRRSGCSRSLQIR